MEDWIIIDKIDIKDIKPFVKKHIKKQNKLSLEYKSTVGNKSSQYDLFNQIKNSSILNLIKSKVIDSFFRIKNKKINIELTHSWTVIGHKDSYHKLHKHCINLETNKLCSVIYLQTPKKSKGENGNFYCVFKKNNKIEYFSYKPKVGDIIIFPVWLFHGVYPQDLGTRQSLNLDFVVV